MVRFNWNSRQLPTYGRWGNVTSSIDWCEVSNQSPSDVQADSAEFWNTLSNLAFIAISLFGIWQYSRENLGARYVMSMLGLCFVGLGSLAFHGTLRYEWQLADELPMIYTSIIVTYCLFATKPIGPTLPIFLFLVALGITAAYLFYPNPVFHEAAYIIISLVNAARFVYLQALLKSKNLLPNSDQRKLQYVGLAGVVTTLGAFGIWNVDNLCCDTLHEWKARLGFPLATLLEGHAYWHIGSGYGAFLMITGATYLTVVIKENSSAFMIERWGFLFFVKRIPRVKKE